MNAAEFNALPIEAKAEIINRFLDPTRPVAVANALIFAEGFTIDFVCSLNGQLLSAGCTWHNEDQQRDALKLLNGQEVGYIDLSELPKVKQTIAKKIFRGTNRYN
jgi:hypothetical protein